MANAAINPTADAPRELAGLSAVVTGSTGGIGHAIAMRLAAAGADCLVHGRRHQASGAEAVRQIEQLGRASQLVLADLATPEGRGELLERAYAWRPVIDIWVNNAGADVLTGDALHWSYDEKLAALWQVDVAATIHLSRAVGERMRAAGGVILNMGWDQAETGMEGESGELFGATKGAVIAFSRSLARSLAPRVRVNCLAPGWIRTAWARRASAYWQRRAASESLMARWGTPEDVAAVAHFLASPAASFISGQVVAVNGGRRYSWGAES